MKKYWQAISNIGIDDDITIFNRKRTKLLNQIALISAIAAIVNSIVKVITQDFFILFHSLTVVSFMSLILWFHSKKKYYQGKMFAVVFFLLLTCSFSVMYGWNNGGQSLLLASFFIMRILLDKKKEYITFSTLHVFVFITGSLVGTTQEPMFVVPYMQYASYLLVATFIYFTLETFKSEQKQKEKDAISLIKTINNKNEALNTQRRMVRYQNDALKKANQELEGAQDLLKASNEDLRTFAYIVSHDLKEPLRMINSYTQLLKRSFKDNLDEDTSQFMFFIIDGSRRMKQMLDDLLQYATAANKEVFKEVVNIKDPISIAIKNLEIPIKEKNANVEFLDDNFPNIHASFSHMTQLFQNLIGNAIKFHKPTMYPLVEISSERKGKYNIIRIQDNGMGIPREKTDSIFSPFERVGHNKIKGTGIGLAICKKIVENHNGKIWVESDTDEGATFYIAFPIEKPIEAEENLEDENL